MLKSFIDISIKLYLKEKTEKSEIFIHKIYQSNKKSRLSMKKEIPNKAAHYKNKIKIKVIF
jgi:hypothetical protein